MHPISAAVASAPSSSAAEIEPTLEACVGGLVAAAAVAIAEGLGELERGRLSARTRAKGGDLIAKIFKLRLCMLGSWDFDRIAVEYGVHALRVTCDDDISDATIAELVGSVMDILRSLTRAALN
jgi:hypothetical protein